jgi:hypothetical protein
VRFLDSRSPGRDDANQTRALRVVSQGAAYMIAVIGNVIAGIGVVSLFTATLRLTRVRK